MELEHSNPPESVKSITGLRKLRFEYHSDDFTMKIGDVYEYWGNGLVFNMLDDQSIDMDTSIHIYGLIIKHVKNQSIAPIFVNIADFHSKIIAMIFKTKFS